jgi:hypothetical protein
VSIISNDIYINKIINRNIHTNDLAVKTKNVSLTLKSEPQDLNSSNKY